jgi:hypothetical protein
MIQGSALCVSFKTELLRGVHDLVNDQLHIALYRPEADLGAETAFYTPSCEVEGLGYQAGGQLLTSPQILTEGRVAMVTFDDSVWPDSTIAARGALIYNYSCERRAIAVLDFGATRVSNRGEFRVRMPQPRPGSALIRIL